MNRMPNLNPHKMNTLKATASLVIKTSTRACRFLPMALLLAVVIAPLAESATETPPNRMTVQSYITDDTGTPLGNTTAVNKKMVFIIYTADTGGTVSFADEQIVTVDKGHFSVVLGEGSEVGDESHDLATAFSGADASDRFIEIQVSDTDGSNPQTLSPRLRLLPSAYSFLSAYANEAAKVTGGGIDTAAIAEGAVDSSKVADGSLTILDLGASSVGTSEVLNNSLTAADLAENSVGNSELKPDLTLSGNLGINQRWPNVTLGLKSVNASDFLVYGLNSAGQNNFYVNSSGILYAKGGLASNMVNSASVTNDTLTASDLGPNSVGASEIAANVVGNSELAPDLTLAGAVGVNKRYSSVAFTTKAISGDSYSTYSEDSAGSVISYQAVDGYSKIYRRVSTNPSYLPVLGLTAVTPNSGTDNWEFAIDVNDSGGGDEDLFFYLGGVQKGWLDADGSGFKASSDRRLKQDISDTGSLLDKVIQLQPRTYRFKTDPEGDLQIGFIAQEVQDLFPEIVDSDEEYLGLSYDRFGVLAVGAIKELNEKVVSLESENAALNERLTALETLVQSLAQ